MNIALEQTEEHVNGVVTNWYGDAFIRGNNPIHVDRESNIDHFAAFIFLQQRLSELG